MMSQPSSQPTQRWEAMVIGLLFLLPLWAWSPYVPSDTRLDAGIWNLGCCLVGGWFLIRRLWPQFQLGELVVLAGLITGIAALLTEPQAHIHGNLQEFPQPWLGLFDRAPWIGFLILSASLRSRPQLLPQILRVWVIGLSAAAGYVWVQIFGFDPLGFQPIGVAPPTAPFANTNVAAELIAPSLLLALWLFQPAKTGWAVIVLLAFPLGYLGVLAARLSLAIGLGWLAIRDSRLRLSAVLAFAALMGGEGARVLSKPAWASPPEVAQGEQTELQDWERPSFASGRVRAEIWEALWQRSLSSPWGIGLGRFEVDYPFYRPAEELRLSTANYTDSANPRPKTPHNELLLILVENGWLGLTLFVFGFILLWRQATRPLCVRLALLVVAIHALVRSPWSDNPLALGLTSLLLLWGCSNLPVRSFGWKSIAPILCIPLAGISGLALILLETDKSTRVRAVALAERTTTNLGPPSWPGGDRLTWSLYVAGLSTEEETAKKRSGLGQLLASDPADLFGLTGLLKLEMLDPEGDEMAGLEALNRAEWIAPEHPSVREGRTLFLLELAKRHRRDAIANLEQGRGALQIRYLTSHLLTALAAVRRDDMQEARSSLAKAAALANENRGLIERNLAREDLDEALVYALVIRVLPEASPWLGPPPATPEPDALLDKASD